MKTKAMIFGLLLLAIAGPGAAQINYPIPLSDIANGARLGCFGGLDCIPAIDNPTWVNASAAGFVRNDDMVMGINLGADRFAVPVNSVWFHEIVNASPFILCYCPLTRTAIAVKPRQGNEDIELGVSGFLFNNNLIMYNRKDGSTFYAQMYFTGISGPRFGQELELRPVTMATWGAWKSLYPDTKMLDSRYYEPTNVYPYGDYRENDDNFIFPQWVDERRNAKELVFGVISANFKARAYPFADMAPAAAINDVLDGENVVVFYHDASQLAVGFDPGSIQGRDKLTFELVDSPTLASFARDTETGSEWNIMGEAKAGPLAGKKLRQLEKAYSGFWFAWAAYFKPIDLYSPTTGIEDGEVPVSVPDGFTLEQNYPNPFNPDTRIRYYLPQSGAVELTIFSVRGERVVTLVSETQAAGWHRVTWQAGNLPAGTYLYRLRAGTQQQVKKLVLLK